MLEDFLSKPHSRRGFLKGATAALGTTALLKLVGCVTEYCSSDLSDPCHPWYTPRPNTPTPHPNATPTPRPRKTPTPSTSNWSSPQRLISNARWPTLSDGPSFIAYIKRGSSGLDVLCRSPFMRDPEAYEKRLFEDQTLNANYPFFEYDNRGILFVVSQQSGGVGDIYRVDTFTGNIELVVEPGNGGGWFPSSFGNFGNIIVYSDRDNDVYSFQSGASGLISQPGFSDSLGDFPKASPVDSRIVSSAHDIIIKKVGMGPYGETTRWVIPGDFDYPCWSPDGQRIAAGGISDKGIWVMDADGYNRQKVTSGHDFAPSWREDTIAFMRRNENGIKDIYTIQER